MNTLVYLLAVPVVILLSMWLYERREKENAQRPVRLRQPTEGPAVSVAQVRFRASMTRR